MSSPSTNAHQGDENPAASANRVLQFFEGDMGVSNIDLEWLDNTITMFGAFGSLDVTPGINGTES